MRALDSCVARIGQDFIEEPRLAGSSRKFSAGIISRFSCWPRATLSYQILITRFFSVMLYYHFAFAAISLAMLGLTRGAMEVYNKPERYAPERVGGGIRPPRLVVRDVGRRRHDRLPVRAAAGSRRLRAGRRWRSRRSPS